MKQNEFLKNSYLWITGLGIGGLLGLSVSPVVSIVITSVAGSASAIIAALSGLEEVRLDKVAPENKPQTSFPPRKINPLPLALLVVGILMGALAGIKARNQSLLGSDVSTEVTKWTQVGLKQEDVVRQLFANQYITSTLATKAEPKTLSPLGTVLFAEKASECTTLRAAALRSPSDTLIRALRSSTVKQLRTLPDIVPNPETLKTIVENVLCADAAG